MSNLRVRLEGARLIGLAAMNEGDAHEDPDPEFKGRYRNRTEWLKGEDGKAELRAAGVALDAAGGREQPAGWCALFALLAGVLVGTSRFALVEAG